MSPVSRTFLPAHAVAHQVVFSTMTMTVALARSELDARKEEHFENIVVANEIFTC